MRTLSFLLTFALVAASGCTGPEATPDVADPGAGGGGNETTSPAPTTTAPSPGPSNVTNTPPTASLTPDVTSGAAPLSVNFTIDGSDEDGDELAWTLSIRGTGVANGTAMPGAAMHNFSEQGSFLVMLTVSDGTTNATANVTIEVASGAPIYAEDFAGDVALPCPICQEVGAGASASWNTGESGLDSVSFALPPEAAGRPFTTTESEDLDSDIEFFASCARDATSLGSFRSVDAHESGTVPNGAGCAVLWTWYLPASVTLAIG